MKSIFHFATPVLFLARAATACLGFAGRHDIFLPLNNTFALANQIPLNAAGYGVSDLGKGAYMVTDGVYQSLVLVSTAGIVLVDAPPTLVSGHKLEWAIGNITTTVPIRWFIYSHSHSDHAGGAYLFTTNLTSSTNPQSKPQPPKTPAKVGIIAHENTASQLKSSNDPRRPPPTTAFKTNYTLQAGNQTLNLFFPGIGHDLGNILIHAPRQRIVMMVDQVFAGWVPFADLAASSYIPGWIEGHDAILSYDFDVYLGGHMGGPANRSAVETQREYVMDLYQNCEGALVRSGTDDAGIGLQGIATDVMSKNPYNAWALFAAYLDAVAERCYNLTSDKWLGRLAGQDVFGYSHAKAMVNSLRLDYDVLGPNGVVL